MPQALVGEDPVLLLRLLDLADVQDGITQSDLQRALQVNQSKLSKLTAKLIQQKWLEEVRPQVPDRRFLFVRTGRRANESVRGLETRLSKLLPLARKTGRRRRLQVTNAIGNLLDRPGEKAVTVR